MKMLVSSLTPVLLSVLVLCSGCDPKTPRAAAAPAPVPPAAPVNPWNWEAFPSLAKMRIATLPCQVNPKSAITVHSPLLGVLRVYVAHPQTNLVQGTVWAEFEPDIFKAESEALEEARVKLAEREKLQMEIEVPKQRLALERQIEEAQRQVALLNLLSTNPEVAQVALNVGKEGAAVLKPEALGKAKTELSLLSQSLSYLEATNLFMLGIDLPGQKSELQRRKLEFERRQSQARLKMPFDGQLTINLPLSEGVVEYPVNAGQELAVARDLSSIRLRIVLNNPAWAMVPPEQLHAVIRMPGGQELSAKFSFQKIERVQTREEPVFYFQFPPEQSELAAKLIGSDVSAEVWMTLPEAARVVPKLSLLLQNPALFKGQNWAQTIAASWPGAKLVVEGQTDLAIAPPKKTALK